MEKICSKKFDSEKYREKMDQARQRWQELRKDGAEIHKCGKVYRKVHPFMQRSLGWIKDTPPYKIMESLADKNKDYEKTMVANDIDHIDYNSSNTFICSRIY